MTVCSLISGSSLSVGLKVFGSIIALVVIAAASTAIMVKIRFKS